MITKVVVIQDKKEFFMAETKKPKAKAKKKKWSDLSRTEQQKIRDKKKAKNRKLRENFLIEKVKGYFYNPNMELPEEDSAENVTFHTSVIHMDAMKFEKDEKNEKDSIWYGGINSLNLGEACEKLRLSVNRWIPEGKLKKLIGENMQNLPDDFDVEQALEELPKMKVYNAPLIIKKDGKNVSDPELREKYQAMSNAERRENDVSIYRSLTFSGVVVPIEKVEHLISPDVLKDCPYFKRKRELDQIKMDPDRENAYFRQKATNILAAIGAPLVEQEGSNRCYMSPKDKHIVTPPKDRFPSDESRLAILVHECIHYSGIELGREFSQDEIKYAKEEMIAELGTALVCSRLGMKTFSSHAKYLKHYADVVSADNEKALLSIAGEANKAANYVLDSLEAYELKQAQKLEQSLEQGIKPSNIAVEGDQISQTFNIDGKKVVAVVDLQDIDNVSFINEKHLNEFALAKPTAKELDEVKTELKSKLREYTVANYDINLEMLRCDELQRKTQNLEVANEELQPEQKQRKRTGLRA